MKVLIATMVAVLAVVGGVASVAAQESAEVTTALNELRRGEFVTVSGTVTRMRDYDEFLIEDGAGRAEIYVRGGMRRPMFRTGDTVIVRGWVDDDLIDIPREIYAVEIELADGTIIEVDGRDWD